MGIALDAATIDEAMRHTPVMQLLERIAEEHKDEPKSDRVCPNCSTPALRVIKDFRERLYAHKDYECVRCGYTS